MLLDPPRTLPVSSLSQSSVRLYLSCAEKWRRRYIENEWEPSSGAAVLGKAVHAAEGTNFQQKIASAIDLPASDVLDEFSDQFELSRERDQDRGGVVWGDDKPGTVKDSGAAVLDYYHRHVAPHVDPVAVERKFSIQPADVDWGFTGYLDLEERSGAVCDLKVRGANKGVVKEAEAAGEIQPTASLLARRAEGTPAPEFRYHNLVRARALEPKHVARTITRRTDEELDAFVDLLYRIAAEIAWRMEYDVWTGPAPGSWWCSERWCGFWGDCPLGGKLRAPTAHVGASA